MFTDEFLEDINGIIGNLDFRKIEILARAISDLRGYNGRIFFIGNGGSSATASHAVNDFRKITNIDCYNISDNVAELTARTNDDGFDSVFVEWLKVSRLSPDDAIFVLSVGGGDKKKKISMNIVKAVDYANQIGALTFGIVGRDGGYTKENGDAIVLIPTVNKEAITPLVESFQSIILHLLVSHPLLKQNQTKWESAK